MCGSCMSHPNATRSKRWKRATIPPFQSDRGADDVLGPVDALLAEGRGAALGAFFHSRQTRRLDEPCPLAAQWQQTLPLRSAQPHPFDQLGSALLDDVDHDLAAGGILEVERELVVRATPIDQLGQRRYVIGQCRSAHLADRPASPERPLDHAVVVENRHPVGGDPHVALEPRSSQFERQFEPGQGVLRGMSPCPSMAKSDGVVQERGEPLLHT